MSALSETSVPVFVDSVKALDEFQWTRCIYYRLDFNHEPPTWPTPAPDGADYAVANLGGAAVLAGPGDGKARFDTLADIEATLDALAADDDVAFELGYCWVPSETLTELADEAIRPGDVFRLPAPLFRLCCRHAAGLVDETAWRDGFASSDLRVESSPAETEAFRAWRRGRIGRTRERYRSESYAAQRLPKREVKR